MTNDYLIDEVSGTEYQTLEQLQQGIFMQLARLIADAVRQNQELPDGSKCDTIEPKELLEVNDDV